MTEINLTREMMKAETALRRCRKNARKAVLAVEVAWLKREQKLVASFPEQTVRHLNEIGLSPAVFKEAPEATVDEINIEDLQFDEALDALPVESAAQ